MDKLKSIKWEDLVNQQHTWLGNHLKAHPPKQQGKTITRFYSVDFSGTQQELTALVDSIVGAD